jgi:Lrp/AsnC family transcriptional regulator, regulator for asnA, asnC and gidA
VGHKVDKIDQAIICLLQEDGRMPAVEIARRCGGRVTERIVRFRIQKLSESGVIRVSAVVNQEALGYTVTADVWIAVEGGNVMEVARKLAGLEQVSYVACSTGDWDISIQVYARSNLELHRFVTETIASVPGVKKANFVILPVIIKDVYGWRIPEGIDSQEVRKTGKEDVYLRE